MFYARYGAGPPGATPWRLGRGLKPPKKAQVRLDGKDTDTFMTRAHIEIQEKLKHTSLDLWQQFSSSPIDSVDLDVIKMWAEAMRPRSIHDLKPMLMLCQSLLRDLASLHKEQLVCVQEDMRKIAEHQLEQVKVEQQARENVCSTTAGCRSCQIHSESPATLIHPVSLHTSVCHRSGITTAYREPERACDGPFRAEARCHQH